MIDNLHHIKQFGYESKAALEPGDLRRFAEHDARALGAQEVPLANP